MTASKRKYEYRGQSIPLTLDKILAEFHKREFLHTDPLELVYRYPHNDDREIVALLASHFAFGNVKAIRGHLEKILSLLGARPSIQLLNRELILSWELGPYRFLKGEDVRTILLGLGDLLREHSTLGAYFEKVWEGDLFVGLEKLRAYFLNDNPSRGLKFFFAHPAQSAAKRSHLFLRWMVRKDEVDLGLWKFIGSEQLILPLDTHLFAICKKLKLTRKKIPSRAAALEITAHLRNWNPSDPIIYDFALCRMGMLKRFSDFWRPSTR